MSNIALQWSLDRTSAGLVSLSMGILGAASADNVQALAMIACERFGVNLAMSSESRHKVSRLCNKSHWSTTVQFLGAQVGYLKGDCAYQLAQSDPGLRFLGLAACLSSAEPWDVAVLLHGLIRNAAEDKMLVPTEEQLKQLLVVIEPKIARSGFCEDIFGWSHLLMNDLRAYPIGNGGEFSRKDGLQQTKLPPISTIGNLIAALSLLGRVGDEGTRIRIVSPTCQASWYIAFVKWCLGEPPRIISQALPSLRSATNHSTSRVSIVINHKPSEETARIETYDQIGALIDLVEDSNSKNWARGLVPVSKYGRMKLRQRFGDHLSVEYRACVEALPYACSYVLKKTDEYAPATRGTGTLARLSPTDDIRPGNVFPSDSRILQAIHEYQGTKFDPNDAVLDRITTGSIFDLPTISLAREKRSKSCSCGTCYQTSTSTPRYDETCLVKNFDYCVSRTVADTLAISLLQSVDPDGVQIWNAPFYLDNYVDQVYKFLTGTYSQNDHQRDSSFQGGQLLQHVFTLLGHDIPGGWWIASSYHDQTIFPQIFSTQRVNSTGLLRIDCMPGSIHYNRRRWQNVLPSGDAPNTLPNIDTSRNYIATPSQGSSSHSSKARTALIPTNDYATHKVVWEIRQGEIALLAAISVPSLLDSPKRDPSLVLEAATKSIFVNCNHDKDTPFSIGRYEIYPLDPAEHIASRRSGIFVLQSDCNEEIRLFALANGKGCVVRMNACIECCVKTALMNQLQKVIL